MCMELVQNAVNGGHKLLLFSQFTTMLDVLAVRLKKAKVSFYMLTGSTSKEKRAQMYMHLMRMILLFSAFL